MARNHRGHFIKRAIPAGVRREVATRYGAQRGDLNYVAHCAYCGAIGLICWFNNTKLGWVALADLEFDHIISEFRGGPTVADNIVLACRPCNRAKRERSVPEWKGGSA